MAEYTNETFVYERKRRGLTQKQWAACLGITEQYVSRIERGHVPINTGNGMLVILCRMVEEFGLPRHARYRYSNMPRPANLVCPHCRGEMLHP